MTALHHSNNAANSRLPAAIATILLAIFLFDVQAALIKHMGTRYPVEQIAFFRNGFGLLPSLVVLFFTSEWRVRTNRWRLVRWKLALGRGLMLILAQMCFYYSLVYMQLATASTLTYASPLFVTLLSIPMLGHKVGWWRGAAVALGFVGVVLVMQPGRDAFSLVALLPVAAAFFYALASLFARYFNDDEPTALISVYSSSVAMVAAFVLVHVTGHSLALESAIDWIWFVVMGVTGGCAVFLLIASYRMSDPSSLSPFEYFGIPFSFCLGWIFFAESPFDSLFPGVLLIVGGGLLVLWRERTLTLPGNAPDND